LLATLFKTITVPNAIASLGIAVVIFGALNFLLSNSQKQVLSETAVKLWNWLDEAKKLPLLQFLRQKNVRFVLAGFGFLVVCGYTLLLISGSSSTQYFEHIAAVISVGVCGIGLWMIPFTLAAKSSIDTLVRATLFLALACLPLTAFFAFTTQQPGVLISDDFIVPLIATVVAFLLWCCIAVPLMLIYSAIAILYVFELLTRRVAEYPKGVLLACSLIFGSMAAILKALN